MRYNKLEDKNKYLLELSDELVSQSSSIQIKKGDFLYKKFEKTKGLFYIQTGLVALTDLSPNGNESLFRVFTDQYFIGHRTFIENSTYHANAMALTNTHVLKLPYHSLEDLQEKAPDLVIHLLKVLSFDLRVSEERFNDLTGKRVLSRIIDSLIFLKENKPDYQWTRREIGEFCGAKTETVTRAFTKLEQLDLVNKDGRDIQIPDLEKLLAYKVEVDLEG